MRHTLSGYLRHRSLPLLAGAVLAILMVYLAFENRRVGLNLWPDFVSGLSQSTLIVGPLASGVAAWESSRWARPASDRIRTAARSELQIRVQHMATVVLPIVASAPVAVLVLAAYGLLTGTYGAPFLPWLIVIAASVTLAASFGYAVGIWLGERWFTAPTATLLFFGLYILSQSVPIPHGIRSLYPVVTNSDTEFARYIPVTMWGQAGLFISLALLLPLVAQFRWGQLPRFISGVAAAALVVVAAVSGAAVISTNGQYLTGYNSRDFVCTGDGPAVCLNRGYEDGLADLQTKFAQMNQKSNGTALQASLLEQNVEGVGDAPADGARSIYVEGIDDAGLRLSVARYVFKYGGAHACLDDQKPYEQIVAVSIVDAWISEFDEYGLSELDPTAPGASEWDRFSGLPPAEGNAWLRDHEAEYQSCTLLLRDLP